MNEDFSSEIPLWNLLVLGHIILSTVFEVHKCELINTSLHTYISTNKILSIRLKSKILLNNMRIESDNGQLVVKCIIVHDMKGQREQIALVRFDCEK